MELDFDFMFIVFAFLNNVYVIRSCETINLLNSCSETDKSGKNNQNTNIKSRLTPIGTQYKLLLETVIQIKEACGNLCDHQFIDIDNDIPNDRTFKRLEKLPQCKKLWSTSIFDQPSNFSFPPRKLPKYLLNYFSRNNLVKILPYYRDDTNVEDDKLAIRAWGKYKFF